MGNKHTPGPWTVFLPDATYPGIEGGGISIVVFDDPKGAEQMDRSTEGVQGNTPEEARANAHLIAAAPELLEALINFVAKDGTEQMNMEAGLRAIAKAKGEVQS